MPLSRQARAVLDHLLDDIAAFAEAGDGTRAEEALQAAEEIAPGDPDVRLERARMLLQRGDEAQAQRGVQALVDAHPGHADARHLLGELLMDAGQRAAAIGQFVEVLRLDEARAARSATGASADLDFIEDVAQQVLRGLPEPLASQIGEVPVVLEARPHPGIVEEGFDPRALGLFEGPGAGDAFVEGAVALRPTRIVLFWANLLDACADTAQLEAEVEVTVLHEVGHYFGLDEDAVAALGLA